jgi:hypothetical protein
MFSFSISRFFLLKANHLERLIVALLVAGRQTRILETWEARK